MKFHLILSVLAISLIATVTAGAKDSRTCRIVFPERSNDAPRFAYITAGGSSQRVTFLNTNFSVITELPKGELKILMTRDKITDFENLPNDVPTLEVAESIQDFYILVTSDPSNELLPIHMELIDISDGDFEPGQTLWCNFTNHAISAKLAERELTLAANSRVIAPSPVSESGNYRAEFSFQPDAKGEFRRITEQQWWHDVESRHMGFIVDSQGPLPKIFLYRDFRSKD